MVDSNDVDKTMLAAEANLIAQGLVTQDDDGLNFTKKGMAKVIAIIDAMSEEDFGLMVGYIKALILSETDK